MIIIYFDRSPAPTPAEVLDALQAAFGPVTATRLEFTAPIVPVDPPAPWWTGLPHKARIVAMRETALRDAPGGVEMRRLRAGETAEYWSAEQGGWLLVYRGPFELWARAMDFQAE